VILAVLGMAVACLNGCACESVWTITNRTDDDLVVLALFPTTGYDPRDCGPREFKLWLEAWEEWAGPNGDAVSFRWYEYATGRPHIAVRRSVDLQRGYWVFKVEDGNNINIVISSVKDENVVVKSSADNGKMKIADKAESHLVGNIIKQR